MMEKRYSLAFPKPEDERAYNTFLAAWGDETIIPYAARPLGGSYTEWLQRTIQWQTNPTPGFAPGNTWFFRKKGEAEILGALNLRYTLTEGLLRTGGHIGYGLIPAARGRGLAPVMLELGLQKARERGFPRVLLTCDKNNTASAKTIQRCGGVLENELMEDSTPVQRYWITL